MKPVTFYDAIKAYCCIKNDKPEYKKTDKAQWHEWWENTISPHLIPFERACNKLYSEVDPSAYGNYINYEEYGVKY